MKFHMLIGLGKDITSIDYKFTMFEVKVTRVTYEKYKHGFHSIF